MISIKRETLFKIYLYFIPFYFLLRNLDFGFSNYAFALNELLKFSLIILLLASYKIKDVKIGLKFPPSIFMYISFLAIGFISGICSGESNLLYAIKYYLYDFIIILLFLNFLVKEIDKPTLYKTLYKISIILSLGSIAQYYILNLGVISVEYWQSFFSVPIFKTRTSFIITNPNLLALLILLGQVYKIKSRKALASILLFAGILYTGSRLYMALSAMLLMIQFLIAHKNIIIKFWKIILVGAIGVFFILNASIYKRIVSSLEQKDDPRIAIWQTVISHHIDNNSILFGKGLASIGTYSGETKSIKKSVNYKGKSYTEEITYIDNQYITLIHEVGILGLLVFILFLGINLFHSIQSKTNISKVEDIAIQSIIIIASFFSDILFSFPIFFIYLISIYPNNFLAIKNVKKNKGKADVTHSTNTLT